ncbi:MAG TPA: response regulator transcription factor [Puia sp.]|nr:response regulator transcription factor [Puia sp.]
MKLLIIEDEPALQQNIAEYFNRRNSQCVAAADLDDAREKLLFRTFDCIILDISLPGGNGLDLLREIREQDRKEGVIILTARDSMEDKIVGLDLGADDYLTKPFHLPELNARINSVMRRRQFDGSKHLILNELKLDVDDRQVYVHHRPILLSRKETALLLLLVSNQRRIVSKAAIADHLSGDDSGYAGNNDLVYSHMKNLKKKLAEAGCRDYIKNIHGLGYKFDCHEAP